MQGIAELRCGHLGFVYIVSIGFVDDELGGQGGQGPNVPAVEIKPILTVASAGAVAAAMEMESTS